MRKTVKETLEGALPGVVEREVISCSAGYIGCAWTIKGLVVLTLPMETASAAGQELERECGALSGHRKKSVAGQCPPQGAALTREWVLPALVKELDNYFSGGSTTFSVPVDWDFCTDFQASVLKIVAGIPWGRVMSYGQVALEAGVPRGARAVGGAMGSNRVLLVVPCHRVIRNDGSLGGFGSGLPWKKRLLEMEGVKPGP